MPLCFYREIDSEGLQTYNSSERISFPHISDLTTISSVSQASRA
jgi:hypothetical protein